MQSNDYINFRKQRDIGEILNATFQFVRTEFKLLFKALLLYAGPFLLFAGIAGAYYQKDMLDFSSSASIFGNVFSSTYFLLLLLTFLSNIMLAATVYSYIKLYIERGHGSFTIDDVWDGIKSNFIMLTGTSFLVAIITALGILLLIIPGIWIGVILSIILILRVMEDIPFGEAFTRCMNLVRDNWWVTFLVLFIIWIITGMASYVFTIPQMIVMFMVGFGEINSTGSGGFQTLFIIVNIIATVGSTLLYVIPLITIALQYFSLVEQKDNPFLRDRINQIYPDDNSTNNGDSKGYGDDDFFSPRN